MMTEFKILNEQSLQVILKFDLGFLWKRVVLLHYPCFIQQEGPIPCFHSAKLGSAYGLSDWKNERAGSSEPFVLAGKHQGHMVYDGTDA